jgi:hypothetical protein
MSRHCPFDTERDDIVTIFRIGNRQKMQGEFGRLLSKVAQWHDPARRGALPKLKGLILFGDLVLE